MKRREVLQSILGLPVIAVLPPLLLEAQTTQTAAAPVARVVGEEYPKLAIASADLVGESAARFFNPTEFATLYNLSVIVLPATANRPGAVEAEVPQFLDFLIGQSGPDMHKLYRDGLGRLEAESRKRFTKPFAELSPEQAAPILAALAKPAPYLPAEDLFERFLYTAKDHFLEATTSSRQWIAASGSRRGIGTYWYPLV